MNTKIGKVIFNPETKKIIPCLFSKKDDWSKNIDYISAQSSGNLIDVTEAEFNKLREGHDITNTEYVYIDGKIQEYVEPLEVKLENAKALKSSELQKVYASEETWKFTIIYEPVQTPALLPLVLQSIIIKGFATTMQFKDKSGAKKMITISSTKAVGVLNDNTKIALALKDTKEAIELKISNAKTIKEIEAIDIQGEFSSIEKVITIK